MADDRSWMEIQLYERVEAFLRRWAYPEFDFGMLACGDPNIVRILREGSKQVSLRRACRLVDFMNEADEVHRPESPPRKALTQMLAEQRSNRRKARG